MRAATPRRLPMLRYLVKPENVVMPRRYPAPRRCPRCPSSSREQPLQDRGPGAAEPAVRSPAVVADGPLRGRQPLGRCPPSGPPSTGPQAMLRGGAGGLLASRGSWPSAPSSFLPSRAAPSALPRGIRAADWPAGAPGRSATTSRTACPAIRPRTTLRLHQPVPQSPGRARERGRRSRLRRPLIQPRPRVPRRLIRP